MGPSITRVNNQEDIRAFFDRAAADYQDQHGDAARLLQYRLSVIGRLLGGLSGGSLLEIGCGTGIHLFALARHFDNLVGTDLSPAMIDSAVACLQASEFRDRISLRVDPADELGTVADASMDIVLCVGAFEHMLNKAQVLAQVHRVLSPGGRFVCLTPNGGYIWYRRVARWLGINTRHLSTDRFLDEAEFLLALNVSGFEIDTGDCWTFVPAGDLNRFTVWLLRLLDHPGRWFGISGFRGGLCICARKPG